MNRVDRLRRDHQILRTKLDTLQSALQMGSSAWFVARELCFTLARWLDDHLRREQALVAECGHRSDPFRVADLELVRPHQPQVLHVVNRLFLLEPAPSFQDLAPRLQRVIENMRREMVDQEHELFLVLEQLTQQDEGSATGIVSPVDETMTVNRIVQQFPGTRKIFEQLFIDVPVEGCACLDEVAWRHGLDAPELLNQLESAIAVPALASDMEMEGGL